jgi:hypothetical protein
MITVSATDLVAFLETAQPVTAASVRTLLANGHGAAPRDLDEQAAIFAEILYEVTQSNSCERREPTIMTEEALTSTERQFVALALQGLCLRAGDHRAFQLTQSIARKLGFEAELKGHLQDWISYSQTQVVPEIIHGSRCWTTPENFDRLEPCSECGQLYLRDDPEVPGLSRCPSCQESEQTEQAGPAPGVLE